MTITVWTKQHKNVLDTLNGTGRYIARREFIVRDLEEHADLVLEVYDWYVRRAAARHPKPADVQYPVWVSLAQAATMMPDQNSVILRLQVDPAIIMPVNIGKWGAMLNYSYIPQDAEDAALHQRLLDDYGVTDAICHGFIRTSNGQVPFPTVQATLWQLKLDWVQDIMEV